MPAGWPVADDRGVEGAISQRDQALYVSVGSRLRAARVHRGWSLSVVEQRSAGELKGSAVANYERGERAISVARLLRLAELYGVTGAELLGEAPPEHVIDLTSSAASWQDTRPVLTFDVGALERGAIDDDWRVVLRYVQLIRAERADSGPVCSLRRDDAGLLALALGRNPEALVEAFGPALLQLST